MKAVITKHDKAVTREMSVEEATIYARQLEELGNDEIKVELVEG